MDGMISRGGLQLTQFHQSLHIPCHNPENHLENTRLIFYRGPSLENPFVALETLPSETKWKLL